MPLVLDPRLVLDDRCRWSAPSVLRRRRTIVKVHRLLYSFCQPRLYSCGELWHQSQNLGPLVSRERRQDEIGQILVNAFSFLARYDAPSFFQPSKCQTSARWSINHQPTLWRVAAYSRPGLPSPTMTFKVIQ